MFYFIYGLGGGKGHLLKGGEGRNEGRTADLTQLLYKMGLHAHKRLVERLPGSRVALRIQP